MNAFAEQPSSRSCKDDEAEHTNARAKCAAADTARVGGDGRIRVALLSPPGRGALGVVGVAGPEAVALVASLFAAHGKKPLANRPDGALCVGYWVGCRGEADADRLRATEEVVVVRRSQTSLEVHCHGGLAASEAVIQSVESRGGVRQSWPEWLAGGPMPVCETDNETLQTSPTICTKTDSESWIEIEAREALCRAGGPKAARIASRQLAGAMERELERLGELVKARDRAAADRLVDRLRRAARIGLRLGRPWRVVMAGAVNAGKSSLVNAMAGYARSLVSAEPGTTRDVLETRLVLDGWEIDLIDTAGLREDASSEVECAGIDRAVAAVAAADLVLRISESGSDLSLLCRGELLVFSKCDLAPAGFAAPPRAIRTSTVTGRGIEELAAAIVRHLVPEEHDDPTLLAGAVPLTDRQMQEIHSIYSHLGSHSDASRG